MNESKTIIVPLQFSGHAEVRVPVDLDDKTARKLAAKVAVARALATFDNPDCGEAEEYACEEFGNEVELTEEKAGRLWDATQTDGISGQWYKMGGR